MPELPDLTLYIEALQSRIAHKRLLSIELRSPFLLRSVDPPLHDVEGRLVSGVRRIGKQIILECEHDYYLVIHLMVSGRFRWADQKDSTFRPPPSALFHFESGTLAITEAGSKKRASLHCVRGERNLDQFRRGGVEVSTLTPTDFRRILSNHNHTLKRSLTDPRLLAGIGNAYSDEILHRARLSPLQRTMNLTDDEWATLFESTKDVLDEWVHRLRNETAGSFPERVTAFRPEMTVHGKFGKPCPVCGSPVQRIRYAENECNYCPRCQTEGRILSDRSMARLLKDDWPRTIEELEGVANRSPRL